MIIFTHKTFLVHLDSLGFEFLRKVNEHAVGLVFSISFNIECVVVLRGIIVLSLLV